MIPLEPALFGLHVPACYGMAADRRFYQLDQQYGRPVLLVLVGAESGTAAAAVLAEVADCGVEVMVVVDDNPALFGACAVPVVDAGSFLRRCDVGAREVMLLLLDRALRVAAQSWPGREADAVARCLAALHALPRETPAPAIVLPNLLSRQMCRHLIELFEVSPTMEGEVARVDASGETRNVVDHGKKHRRDMPIAADTELHLALQGRLLARCAPEITRAFGVTVTATDRILVARYDDTGGYFRRHRDNAAQHVAFREFALSLNLNAEEYEGGDLLFPEYNEQPHRPPTGAGLIFSAAVLHEAMPVRRGRRYVLLTFFHRNG